MALMTDFHLQWRSIVIEYILEIISNFVFATNPMVVRNIGIIIISKIIDLIVVQEQYLTTVCRGILIRHAASFTVIK